MRTAHVLVAVLVTSAIPAYAEFKPKKIVVGSLHTCALSEDGRIKCWGYNDGYQLGTGDDSNHGRLANTMGTNLVPVNLGAGQKAVDLCAGSSTNCAVTSTGQVKCWGGNIGGVLGHGQPKLNSGEAIGDALPFTDLGNDFHAKSIYCGYAHVCALTEKGRAKCWGSNIGNLGIGNTLDLGFFSSDMGENLPYLPVQKPIESITASTASTCAITSDGLRCWGRGSEGQLGQESQDTLGDTDKTSGDKIPPIPLNLQSTQKIDAITSGTFHSCALILNSEQRSIVKCWGSNSVESTPVGTLGIGSNALSWGNSPNSMGPNLPVVDVGEDDVVDIQAHGASTCVLTRRRKVKCWGLNSAGQLGIGSKAPKGLMASDMGAGLQEVDLGLPALSLAVGSIATHNCAILINHGVKCWGDGAFGKLGVESGDTNYGDAPGQMGEALPQINLGD